MKALVYHGPGEKSWEDVPAINIPPAAPETGHRTASMHPGNRHRRTAARMLHH